MTSLSLWVPHNSQNRLQLETNAFDGMRQRISFDLVLFYWLSWEPLAHELASRGIIIPKVNSSKEPWV